MSKSKERAEFERQKSSLFWRKG